MRIGARRVDRLTRIARRAHHTDQMNANGRDALLAQALRCLRTDRRFLAAWLSGSIAAGTADEWSDLDLYTVVSDADYEAVRADRSSLFSAFGTPILVQEIRANSTADTFFALIVYPGGLELDFSLLPQSLARRHPQTLLLFDNVGIEPALEGLPVKEEARLQLDFFWAMGVVAVRCAARRNAAHAANLIEMMTGAFDTLWRFVHQPNETHPETLERRHRPRHEELVRATPLLGEVINPVSALEVIAGLCSQTALLHPTLGEMGVPIPIRMPEEIQALVGRARRAIGASA